jgi:hypothetical protein
MLLEYIHWDEELVSGLRGASPELEGLFDRVAEEAERSVQVPPVVLPFGVRNPLWRNQRVAIAAKLRNCRLE